MDGFEAIARALEEGKKERVAELTREALASGSPPKRVLDEGLIAGMGAVGERFRRHEIFLPHVLLAAWAMIAGMDILTPLLGAGEKAGRGTAVIGTVRGDLHDIGKNLVCIMLRGAGFEVIDLGSDVAPAAFVESAEKHGARVIGMSALLTTTMQGMGEVTALLRERGLSGRIRTIVGGAPLSQDFADSIGADAYAFDGVSAVDRVAALMRATGS